MIYDLEEKDINKYVITNEKYKLKKINSYIIVIK